ncbi:YccF domain-containing protein [Leifsonia sp. YIM 134122]|uniref:YccF domain-containing protein n=1 Tax=Leifsonia stereocauli TaxID=3134136 RepID=A0ABU9W768_9MICO
MRLLLNIIWLVLSGFWLFLGYVAAGVICCILIITIPFGIASFRIALYALWPFGRTVVATPTSGALSFIGNVIWFVVAGLWLAIAHVVSAAALAITIIGIPFAWANLKMIPVSLAPLGKQIIDQR